MPHHHCSFWSSHVSIYCNQPVTDLADPGPIEELKPFDVKLMSPVNCLAFSNTWGNCRDVTAKRTTRNRTDGRRRNLASKLTPILIFFHFGRSNLGNCTDRPSSLFSPFWLLHSLRFRLPGLEFAPSFVANKPLKPTCIPSVYAWSGSIQLNLTNL